MIGGFAFETPRSNHNFFAIFQNRIAVHGVEQCILGCKSAGSKGEDVSHSPTDVLDKLVREGVAIEQNSVNMSVVHVIIHFSGRGIRLRFVFPAKKETGLTNAVIQSGIDMIVKCCNHGVVRLGFIQECSVRNKIGFDQVYCFSIHHFCAFV